VNKSILSSANLARVILEEKSMPLYKESTSMGVSVAEEIILFALSQAVLAQPPQSFGISTNILLVLPLKYFNEMLQHSVVKVLTSEVSVSNNSLYFKTTFVNSK
jgi:hypothetical protein